MFPTYGSELILTIDFACIWLETVPDMQTSEIVEFFGFETRNGFRNSLKFECR